MRIDVAVAIALACGGWVCDGDNPCVGANTCDVDVAKVCCPFDQPYWCNGACAHDCGPDDVVYTCRDEAPPPACVFSATISALTCTPEDTSGINWHVLSAGTVTGCGDEAIYFERKDTTSYGGLDCGDWTLGRFRSSCLPHGTTSSWSVDDVLFPLGDGARISVTVKTGAGEVLATMSTGCH